MPCLQQLAQLSDGGPSAGAYLYSKWDFSDTAFNHFVCLKTLDQSHPDVLGEYPIPDVFPLYTDFNSLQVYGKILN